MYGATSGKQPPIWRQRCMVRVREGGFDGPVVGIEKMAIGSGNWTGDASWGGFATTYSPGQVPLVPGKTYAIEFNLIETRDTIGDYINFKKQENDGIPGFAACPKHELDEYPDGTAQFNGEDTKDYDLDMQIVEYENDAENWTEAVDEENLLVNADFETGELDKATNNAGDIEGWEQFKIDPGTLFRYLERKDKGGEGRYVRVTDEAPKRPTVDGGFVQKVPGLSHFETYRLSGDIRCSWAVNKNHQLHVGYDPTGQVESATADTIVWKVMPRYHGFWIDYESEPIRPAGDSISVWLRGRSVEADKFDFDADFDNFALHRVKTSAPMK
jgi:hypothetical protein